MSDVEVMVRGADDVWRPGRLITWRWADQSQGTWRAFVTYPRGVGDCGDAVQLSEATNPSPPIVRLHWVDGDHVRRLPERE